MRQYRQLHGNDIVKELVEEIASTLISRLHFRCLRFQYQTVGHPVQVAAKIIREVSMKLSMKIQPYMTPYGVAVSLHDPHVLARSSLPAGIDDDVFVGSALAPDPSPDGSMAVVGAFHEVGAAACPATSSAPQAAEPQKPKKKRKSATHVATAAAPMDEAKCCPIRALERRPTTSSFAKTSKHSEGTGTTCKRVRFTAAVDASVTDVDEQTHARARRASVAKDAELAFLDAEIARAKRELSGLKKRMEEE